MNARPDEVAPLPPDQLRALYTRTFGSLETISVGGTLRAPENAPTLPSAQTRARDAEPGFEVGDEIGRGGMGVVYRSRQRCLNRDVAVKRIHPSLDSDASRGQFVSEALVTAWLDHPNIVPVHDLTVEASGDVCLAMKLVGGRSWADVLRHRKEDPEWFEQQLEVLIGVSNAVAFAHSKGIIHRDLKPENVMVGEYGEVLVMDWGIAIDVAADPSGRTLHRSQVSCPSGTPSYMAPELAEGRGGHQDARTDVFLLGAMLHELSTGHPPYQGDDLISVLTAASECPVQEYDARVPDELQVICRRAMSRRAQDRYPDAIAFQDALRGFLRHRESAAIAEHAQTVLAQCEEEAAGASLHEAERNILYGRYAEAVAGFHQALAMWDGNARARSGERNARLAYARTALRIGDLGLADAQLHCLDDLDVEVDELRQTIAGARSRQQRVQRTNRGLRYGLLGLAAVLLVGGTLALVTIRNESSRTAEREWTAQRNDARRFYERGIAAMSRHSYEAAAALFLHSLEIAPADDVPEGYPSSWSDPAWPEESWIALRHAYSLLGPQSDPLPDGAVGPVAAAAFSPNNPDQIALLGKDGSCHLWGVGAGSVRSLNTAAPPAGTRSAWIAFDQHRGRLLAGYARSSLDTTAAVRAIDIVTGAAKTVFTGTSLLGDTRPTAPLALLGATSYEDSCELLFTSRDPRTLHLASLPSETGSGGRPPADLPCALPQRAKILCAVANRRQKRVVVGADDGAITAFDSSQSELRALRTMVGHTDGITCIAMDPLSHVVLSGSHDRTVRLWELESGRLLRTFEGHKTAIISVAIHYAAPNRTAVSVSSDGQVLTWNLEPGVSPRKLPYGDKKIPQERGPVAALAVSPDGHYAVAATGLPRTRATILAAAGINEPTQPPVIWDLQERQAIGEGPKSKVRPSHFRFASDGQSVFTQAGDTCTQWNVATGEILATHSLVGESLAYGELGVAVQLGALPNTGIRKLGSDSWFRPFAGQPEVQIACISGDGGTVLTGSPAKDVWMWQLPEVEAIGQIACGVPVAMALDHRGHHALIASENSDVVQLWDLRVPALVRQWPSGSGSVRQLEFSPDGTLALYLTGTAVTALVIHDARTGARLHTFEPAVLEHVSLIQQLTSRVQDYTTAHATFGPDSDSVMTHLGADPVLWRFVAPEVPREPPLDLEPMYARVGLRVSADELGSLTTLGSSR